MIVHGQEELCIDVRVQIDNVHILCSGIPTYSWMLSSLAFQTRADHHYRELWVLLETVCLKYPVSMKKPEGVGLMKRIA